MLKTLRERGFTPHGVEITESGAWHAKERLQIPVYVGHVTDAAAPFRPGQFEVIIFWHSLEHVVDAPATLKHAVSLLKPGGLLVVAVPNSDSLQARMSGPSWFHLDVPRHYTHFGARSLRRLLEEAGLRIVKEDHFSAEQNPYGWLQSLFNMLGFDFNFLYAAVKSKSARRISRRQHPIQSLLTALLLPPLLLFSLGMTLVEAALRRGGTIEVYALKR
jgi:SAM-dependent methyltransferase